MAMKLNDVEYWTVAQRGIGHVVMWVRDGWVAIACGKVGNFPDPQKERPARICRDCRRMLWMCTSVKASGAA